MLRIVVEQYLASVTDERDFDAPFMSLLRAQGFYDVRFTHGRNEFGRDFIAKRSEDGGGVQYSFQLKSDNITVPNWRELSFQIFEALSTDLPQSDFNANLPHRAVLVTTGTATLDATRSIHAFNENLAKRGIDGVELWPRAALLEQYLRVDPSTVYPPRSDGFRAYADFFVAYGHAMSGELNERALEKHSRYWAHPASTGPDAVATAMLEAYALAERSKDIGDLHLALIAKLAAWRAVMVWIFEGVHESSFLVDLMARARAAALSAARDYVEHVWTLRETAGARLARAVNASGALFAYRVHAARFIEALALLYFLDDDGARRETTAERLRKVVVAEAGAAQPVSDRYAVSIVAAVRALVAMGRGDDAARYLQTVAVWVLGQYADRSGLAPLEADEEEATEIFLAADFPELKRSKRTGSFLITAIVDLAAFLDDQALYADVVSDIETHKIHPEYVILSDTDAQLFYEHADLARIISVPFDRDAMVANHRMNAPHLTDEPTTFRLAEHYGSDTLLAISLLLRDRYFPTTFLRPRSS